MGLAEDIDDVLRRQERPVCKICTWLLGAAGEERAAVVRAINSPIGLVQLSRIFQRNGYKWGVPTITLHRNEHMKAES